jgi:hypothetical protein
MLKLDLLEEMLDPPADTTDGTVVSLVGTSFLYWFSVD